MGRAVCFVIGLQLVILLAFGFSPAHASNDTYTVTLPYSANGLSIDSSYEQDRFSFHASAGDTIIVEARAGNQRNLEVELYAPDGSWVGGDDTWFGTTAGIFHTATMAGTYEARTKAAVLEPTPIGYSLAISLLGSTTTTVRSTTTTTQWTPPNTTTTIPTALFSDVPAWHPYLAAVTGMKQAGIIDGYLDGSFRPDNPVFRQHFAKMIVGALSIPVNETLVAPFSDLGLDDPGDLYPHEYIAAAASYGITNGTAPGQFSPWADITRAQVVTMIVRGAQSLKPGALATPPAGYAGPIPNFSDVHSPNMRVAEYNSLMTGLIGFGPGWNPWAKATRGEVAQILWNVLALIGPTPPVTSTTTTASTTTTSTTTTTFPPTTTTTQAPRRLELSMLSRGFRASWVVPEWGWVNLMTAFKLKNTGTVALNVDFSVAGPYAVDGSGQKIGWGFHTTSGPPTLGPGETGYYVSNDLLVDATLTPSRITDVGLTLQPDDFAASAAHPVKRLSIDSIQNVVGESVMLTARVNNNTAVAANGVSGVIMLESGGKPIGGVDFFDGRVLLPGASEQIEVTMPIVLPAALSDVAAFSGVVWTTSD